ncbi:MAG: polyprenyl diphosphate synthase [Patescibacteria group bacterium]|nr:polyprenyl diphosphate synthase [Patescibacteria group bacterium]
MTAGKFTIPNHVAIIPDGNRRWAKRRSLKPWKGHDVGARRTEELIKEAFNVGIRHLTFWGSSRDNIQKRPLVEKRVLLSIYGQYFKKLIESDEVYEKQVRIDIIGKWKKQFPKKLVNILSEAVERTKHHSKYFLTFLLAYNGDDDIIFAAQKLVEKAHLLKKQFKVTKSELKSQLMTSRIPNVDLLIRTGVENDPHNSTGFLMWQTRNTQYYFSDLMYPDFSASEFRKAVKNFSKRARRFGS